ncbi:MAG: hypothetical protein ACLFRY_12805 [Spirochaetia bacterium]
MLPDVGIIASTDPVAVDQATLTCPSSAHRRVSPKPVIPISIRLFSSTTARGSDSEAGSTSLGLFPESRVVEGPSQDSLQVGQPGEVFPGHENLRLLVLIDAGKGRQTVQGA